MFERFEEKTSKKMSKNKCALSFRGITLGIILSFLFCGSGALRTYYVSELCNGWSDAILDLRYRNTGILEAVSSNLSPAECKIRLKPELGAGVVLSIYRFNLGPQDKLMIEDATKFKVALIGEGDFPDESKSFLSGGSMTVHYIRNDSANSNSKLKFKFVFTQVREQPCAYDEFKCRNNKCIPKNLLCDRHNHCGDSSDQEDCGLNKFMNDRVRGPSNAWMISIIVCSSILGIVIIAFVAVLIRGCVKRRKKSQAAASVPTVAASVPAAAPSQTPVAPPSVFARFRESFRAIRQPKPSPDTPSSDEGKKESYEVPSMYPQIPSAPDFDGVDNPEFKADV